MTDNGSSGSPDEVNAMHHDSSSTKTLPDVIHRLKPLMSSLMSIQRVFVERHSRWELLHCYTEMFIDVIHLNGLSDAVGYAALLAAWGDRQGAGATLDTSGVLTKDTSRPQWCMVVSE